MGKPKSKDKVCCPYTQDSKNKGNLFFDKIKPVIELIAILIGLYFGVTELKYLSTQIQEQSKQIEKQSIWTKQDVTFQYLKHYSDEMSKTANYLKNLSDTTNFANMLKNNEYRTNIMNLVAYFDDLAIGIKRDYFDETIAKESFIPETLAIHDKLKKFGYFEIRKNEMGADVALHFRELVEKWQNQK